MSVEPKCHIFSDFYDTKDQWIVLSPKIPFHNFIHRNTSLFYTPIPQKKKVDCILFCFCNSANNSLGILKTLNRRPNRINRLRKESRPQHRQHQPHRQNLGQGPRRRHDVTQRHARFGRLFRLPRRDAQQSRIPQHHGLRGFEAELFGPCVEGAFEVLAFEF